MLECLQREGREFHSSVLVCMRMYFHGNSTMLGVITSSVQKVSLHTSPDVCVTRGYVFTFTGSYLYTSCMSSYPV